MENTKKVAIIMGSDSDWPTVNAAAAQLKSWDIPFEVRVMSAHRTPAAAAEFAKRAAENGFGVIIAAAGMAAHLAGSIAANTVLPVVGIPVKGGAVDGLDALLATVQMPSGIPVATVALNGAKNAAVLAAQMLAIHDARIAALLAEDREKMARRHPGRGGRAVRNAFQISFYFYKTQKREKNNMEKREQLYEGKAKKVFATDDADLVIVDYKDDATAGDGAKKGTIRGKGVVNNRLSNNLMKMLAEKGVPTHFVEELSDRETLVKKVEIVPLEVIIRNISAGHFASKYGVEEGFVFEHPSFEFSYKNDDLGDPLINSYHALALKLATKEEIDTIIRLSFKVDEVLQEFFLTVGIKLVDFKLEFGRTSDGTIILADEISPDTCRLWDKDTNEKLDKDRFRRDLGNVEDAYQEVMSRLLAKSAEK